MGLLGKDAVTVVSSWNLFTHMHTRAATLPSVKTRVLARPNWAATTAESGGTPASRNDSMGKPSRGGGLFSQGASSSTRSNGTLARATPESNAAWAHRAVSSKDEPTGTTSGMWPMNQPLVTNSAGLLWIDAGTTA